MDDDPQPAKEALRANSGQRRGSRRGPVDGNGQLWLWSTFLVFDRGCFERGAC